MSEHEDNNDSKYFDFEIIDVAVPVGDGVEVRYLIKDRIAEKDSFHVGWND
jgi:hypothetical protein